MTRPSTIRMCHYRTTAPNETVTSFLDFALLKATSNTPRGPPSALLSGSIQTAGRSG
jgi:hypothetical protein